MRCVKCDGTLHTVGILDGDVNVDVDQCQKCGGIWFDAHELERILRRGHVEPLLGRAPAPKGRPARAATSPSDDERRGRCPRCKGEGYLVRLASSRAKLHVDTCAICGGKWLDGGELDLLARTTLGDRLRRALRWMLDLDLP